MTRRPTKDESKQVEGEEPTDQAGFVQAVADTRAEFRVPGDLALG